MIYAVMPILDWDNILDSVKAKTGKSDPLASGDVASEIDSISGDGDTIPKYVMQEAEATIAKAKSHGNISRMIRFIAISDTHEDSANTYPTAGVSEQIAVSNRHAGQAIRYISDRIELDFIAHLGDASGCGAFSTTYAFDALCEDITRVRKNVFLGTKDTKHVFIPGNHDMMSTPGRSLLNSGAYILFGSLCSGNKDAVGGYGYFDIDDAKVRVIYLNTSDSPSSAAYLALTQAQKNWLCETLINVNTKSNATEWKIIILSHAPLDFGGVASISTDILIPYVNGGTYSSYSFNGKNSAKIIGNVHGHVHCFSYGYLNDRVRRFTIPNACYVGSNHYATKTEYASWTDATTYNKTANSGKDTSFSLVTIDLDSGECYVDNYGAGIDRAFSTDYKPIEVIVPTSISNISYSGDTTVGTAIDKSKFTFTVTYNNGTTRTVTGATSVDTATIGVVGSNPVTITYTESGVTVSGTITIEGTAKPVENLFDKNDPDILLRGRFNSSNIAVEFADNQLCTGYIEGKFGDKFTITTDKANNANNYTGNIMLYDSNKNPLFSYTWQHTYDDIVVSSEDYKTVTFNVVSSYPNMDWSTAANTDFVRFCVAYTDINSIVITKA